VVSYIGQKAFLHPHTIHLIRCSDGWLLLVDPQRTGGYKMVFLVPMIWEPSRDTRKLDCWGLREPQLWRRRSPHPPLLTTAGGLMSDPRSDNRPNACPSPPAPSLFSPSCFRFHLTSKEMAMVVGVSSSRLLLLLLSEWECGSVGGTDP
jgi:hypothetical protein